MKQPDWTPEEQLEDFEDMPLLTLHERWQECRRRLESVLVTETRQALILTLQRIEMVMTLKRATGSK